MLYLTRKYDKLPNVHTMQTARSNNQPIVDACYAGEDLPMCKILMLSYKQGRLQMVVAEDILGQTHYFTERQWLSFNPIPICFTGEAQQYSRAS